MAGRPRVVRYLRREEIQRLLEQDSTTDESEPNESDSEEEADHISEASDRGDTESASDNDPEVEHHGNQQRPDDREAEINQGRGRGHGRGRGRGRGRGQDNGAIPQGQAQPNNPAVDQDHIIGKDGTVWDKAQPPQGRRRAQDILRQAPGITPEGRCTDILQSFQLFITQPIVIQIVQETNREGRRKTTEYNAVHPQSQKVISDF